MIVRYEPWGAWVKLEREAALVALDREGVRALGLDGGKKWDDSAESSSARASMPIEVHVAVTARCGAGCEGCYLDATPEGVEPPREEIEATLDALAKAGVFTVAFGGGEPTLREDLGELADHARSRGLTPVVTTSGIGLGPAKLTRLARFSQVNVSYDGPGDAYAAVRGFDASAAAESAIVALAARGIAVGVNVVLTRATFGRVRDTLARARSLGATEAQLLRYKPAGRATTLDYQSKRLSLEQARGLGPLLRELARNDGMRVRIDCALVPFLSADPDLAARPEKLAQWGVLGCEAGSALGATRVDGTIAPCSFAPPSTLHATDIRRGWNDDPALREFRAFVESPPEPCASCTLRPVCRGGCKIVGGFRPDPECPRVASR
jgi:radical SAM protein with 4Fe4S-binding SPASM domain